MIFYRVAYHLQNKRWWRYRNFAEEMSSKALLSSLVRTRNIPGYSFFRDIANARHRQTSLSLLSLNRDVVKRME